MRIAKLNFVAYAGLAASLWFGGGPVAAQALKLDDRLNPPQTVRLPALPGVEGPQPRSASPTDLQVKNLAPLPVAEIPRTLSGTKAESVREPWRHPALDQPSLAGDLRPQLPAEPRRPTVAGSFVRGPRIDDPFFGTAATAAVDPPLKPTDDPQAAVALEALTRPVAVLGPPPPPLLRLTIPDPYAVLRASRISQADLDRDPPVVSLDRPPPLVLSAPK